MEEEDNPNRNRKRKRGKNPKQKAKTSLTNPATLKDQQPSNSSKKSSSFLDKMRAKLSGGHFRMINEKLYTCSGDEALDYFKEDPSLFDMYHAGYQEQMSRWPEQPVNIITKWLKDHNPSLVVADFGCGDARLAKGVKNKEAHRVLKQSGWLLIAEVKSRFDPNNGGADPDRFLKAVCELGFTFVSKEKNKSDK